MFVSERKTLKEARASNSFMYAQVSVTRCCCAGVLCVCVCVCVPIVVMCDNFIGVGVAAITAALEVFRKRY